MYVLFNARGPREHIYTIFSKTIDILGVKLTTYNIGTTNNILYQFQPNWCSISEKRGFENPKSRSNVEILKLEENREKIKIFERDFQDSVHKDLLLLKITI